MYIWVGDLQLCAAHAMANPYYRAGHLFALEVDKVQQIS